MLVGEAQFAQFKNTGQWRYAETLQRHGSDLASVYRTDKNKHFPAEGKASLCGLIVECDVKTGLANSINQFIYGGELKNSQQ